MNMDFGLYQQQAVKMMMTNELRQAITILQYSAQELLSYLEEQQLENPLIEVEKHVDEFEQHTSTLIDDDQDEWKTYDGENNSPFDYVRKDEITLQEHLCNQIRYLPLEDKEKKIVQYIVYSLDENGYFPLDLMDFASTLSISVYDAASYLNIVQSLEPTGVGARSLQECLLLQLRKLPHKNDLAENIIENELQLFANKKWKELAQKYRITIETVQEVADLIQTLQPKPGAVFSNNELSYIIPDTFIECEGDKLVISINDKLLPTIKINHSYRQYTTDESVQKYLQKKYQQVEWLMKSIDQRQQTLLKVTEAIAHYQKDFFKYGYHYLKPLTLKEVAAAIDVHESTVSRATTQKYVQTPRGLFELKYFFSSSVKSEGDTNTSSLAVKERLKKIIDLEDKRKPLSDQKIASMLKTMDNIEISRRTVAKYRDELNILSSAKRKRFN